MKLLTILVLAILFISCDKNEEEAIANLFEVTTVGIDIDCKLILIDFRESELDRLEKITNLKTLKYQAFNLDKNKYNEDGQMLTITVRKTADSELFPCTTLGPSYPWVTVLEAKLKE